MAGPARYYMLICNNNWFYAERFVRPNKCEYKGTRLYFGTSNNNVKEYNLLQIGQIICSHAGVILLYDAAITRTFMEYAH